MLTRIYANGAAFLYSLKHDQRGVTAIEYAVVAVAIAGLVAAVFTGAGSTDGAGTLSKALTDAFTNVANIINGVTPPEAE